MLPLTFQARCGFLEIWDRCQFLGGSISGFRKALCSSLVVLRAGAGSGRGLPSLGTKPGLLGFASQNLTLPI
jgi:hypothetical protein